MNRRRYRRMEGLEGKDTFIIPIMAKRKQELKPQPRKAFGEMEGQRTMTIKIIIFLISNVG